MANIDNFKRAKHLTIPKAYNRDKQINLAGMIAWAKYHTGKYFIKRKFPTHEAMKKPSEIYKTQATTCLEMAGYKWQDAFFIVEAWYKQLEAEHKKNNG